MTRSIIATSFFVSLWLYLSFDRSLSVQKVVFEARRINNSNIWPRFTAKDISDIGKSARSHKIFHRLTLALVGASFFLMSLFTIVLMLDWVGSATLLLAAVASLVILIGFWLYYIHYGDFYLTEVLQAMKEAYSTSDQHQQAREGSDGKP